MNTSADHTLSTGQTVKIDDCRFELMIGSNELQERIRELGAQLSEDYSGTLPILVGVLKGAVMFLADLGRQLAIPAEFDFVGVSSYGDSMTSSGEIIFTAEPGTEIAGRNVLIVEDIVDTGHTIQALREYFKTRGATSVRVATLLYKYEADVIGVEPEYCGFRIPDRFVVGFGMDYKQQGRNLPAIYVLAE